jgi:ribulose-phosphate 3-epimerase
MRPAADWIDALPPNRLLAELSLWSADLGHLAAEIERFEGYTDIYHIDVADGHFSPAMLFFPDLVGMIRKRTAKPLHVHLMVADHILCAQIEQFAEAGADLISVHAENQNVDDALERIAKLGLPAGIVLQLHTPAEAITPYLDRIRFLTFLGTRIGIKGQGLDATAEPRLRMARTLMAKHYKGQRIVLAADGGIREQTVPRLRHAGAETIVMGSLAFNEPKLAERMAWVHAQPLEA